MSLVLGFCFWWKWLLFEYELTAFLKRIIYLLGCTRSCCSTGSSAASCRLWVSARGIQFPDQWSSVTLCWAPDVTHRKMGVFALRGSQPDDTGVSLGSPLSFWHELQILVQVLWPSCILDANVAFPLGRWWVEVIADLFMSFLVKKKSWQFCYSFIHFHLVFFC